MMNQPQTMLELQQLVLNRLSDDKALFRKEIIKSIIFLGSEELIELHEWLKINYRYSYDDVLAKSFAFSNS